VTRVPAGGNGDPARLSLEITGPTAIFRNTGLYGNAMARFLPACALGTRFRIEARILLDGREGALTVTDQDHIVSPHREPRKFDSRLEARFEEDFEALGSRWRIRREERMVPLGRSVFFPDFTFRPREGNGPVVDLEILGFWTGDYVARKLRVFESLRAGKLIVCADSRLRCDAGGTRARVLLYRRRVDARAVLHTLEEIAREE
jgi:predicted nuclease of restriction endonuclease-like RecB superfamily